MRVHVDHRILLFITLIFFFFLYIIDMRTSNTNDTRSKRQPLVHYDHDLPLIWIGGIPRSGTTLLRAMLDAHPDIRCGPETDLISQMLAMLEDRFKQNFSRMRLEEANVTETVAFEALGGYMLSIIVNHGERANRYCNQGTLTHQYMPRLYSIFPNSKFLLMVRDGRAVVHSVLTKTPKAKRNVNSYREGLQVWNRNMSIMWDQCKTMREICKPVFYEKLVLNPELEMTKILSFLGVKFDKKVLHHEQMIGKPGGVVLAAHHASTSQVKRPLHQESLRNWVGHIPEDVRNEMEEIAPMLELLGYDPSA